MTRYERDLIEQLFQTRRMVKNVVANRIEEITETRLPEFVVLARRWFESPEKKEDALVAMGEALMLVNWAMCQDPEWLEVLRHVQTHLLERYRVEMNMPYERFYEGRYSR